MKNHNIEAMAEMRRLRDTIDGQATEILRLNAMLEEAREYFAKLMSSHEDMEKLLQQTSEQVLNLQEQLAQSQGQTHRTTALYENALRAENDARRRLETTQDELTAALRELGQLQRKQRFLPGRSMLSTA
ncbi:hypothetical protein F6X40_10310 [Paraburkholderia sp. UCT31]|uniref:hypothetical protein n=1 Tax=Paraburkholderia sp. UCT31 TaxID=2615209 RepID=UPI0016559B4E|nr:hypothetical protein [Paraburkholderia sp. UCT31]MBC8737201.1 hypothetical protein [Paraburkholderia sp. UCT31]